VVLLKNIFYLISKIKVYIFNLNFLYLFNFFICFVLFLSLPYLFVPLYEYLCTQFGLGLVYYSNNNVFNNVDFSFLSRKDNSSIFFNSTSSNVLKQLLLSNIEYRRSVHFDSTHNFLLLPVLFKTNIHGNLPLSFYLNENLIQVRPDVSQLIVFNIFNFSDLNIDFFIGYQIFPYFLTKYIIKIQCFCYEHILIMNNSFLKLPVLFFISSDIMNNSSSFLNDSGYYSYIIFYYHIFKSNFFVK
jgi:cytochrome c oxidase assembly protein Cox11